MKRRLCIVEFNIVTYIGLLAKHLLVLIREEDFYHLGLRHFCNSSRILTSGFEAGELRFISMWYDKLITNKPHILAKKWLWNKKIPGKHRNMYLPMYLNLIVNIQFEKFNPQFLWMYWRHFQLTWCRCNRYQLPNRHQNIRTSTQRTA